MSLSNDELQQVIDRVLAGDREAFLEIVRSHGLMLRSYLASQLYYIDEVDDLAQETFIAVYRNLGKFRKGEDFGAWLRGVARNKLYMFYRGRSRRGAAMERFREEVNREVEQEIDGATSGDTSENVERLLGCIARLPERMRRVVRAGLDGVRTSALAEEMETSPAAIYNLNYRAHQLLKECLARDGRTA